jgi:hypothetical protein
VLLSCAPQPATCPAACMPVMRFPVGELPGTHRSSSVWDRLHPARVACSYGISKRTICSVWGAAVPFHATTLLLSICQDVQHMICAGALFTQEIAIREDADSPHGRPTLRAALEASAPQHKASEMARVRY